MLIAARLIWILISQRRGRAPVFAVSGARFVNLQYGDTAAEIAEARRVLGVSIRSVPEGVPGSSPGQALGDWESGLRSRAMLRLLPATMSERSKIS